MVPCSSILNHEDVVWSIIPVIIQKSKQPPCEKNALVRTARGFGGLFCAKMNFSCDPGLGMIFQGCRLPSCHIKSKSSQELYVLTLVESLLFFSMVSSTWLSEELTVCAAVQCMSGRESKQNPPFSM